MRFICCSIQTLHLFTARKMKILIVILLLRPVLLEAGLISIPSKSDTCVGDDRKLNWKYDNPTQIDTVLYKVTLPGGSPTTILAYDGTTANVFNNYNVRWDAENGSITVVNSTLNNSGNYSILVTYLGPLSSASDSVPLQILDPPKNLYYKRNNMEFTCLLDSLGTPSVSLYIQLNGHKKAITTLTAKSTDTVECCVDGPAVGCMSGNSLSTECRTVQTPECDWYCYVAIALICVYGALIIIVCIIYILAICDIVVPQWLMFIEVILLCLILVWAVIMIFLLIKCTDVPWWCILLVAITLYGSLVSAVVMILVLCGCCKGKNDQELLRKLLCFDKMDKEERKDLAALLLIIIVLIPWTFGFILLVPCCCEGRFAEIVKMFWCHYDSEELPHGQRTGHSDAGRGRAAESTRPKDKHQAALIDKSSRHVHEQPRPQPPPPLPGIGKSHNDKGIAEPHNTNTRGLSINYDDPNTMPQFDVRKSSLAPISAGFQEESDRKKKKRNKKKKTEGNDAGRIEED